MRKDEFPVVDKFVKDSINETLDKIRAEIDEQYDRLHPYNIDVAQGLEMALEILNKYNPESEVSK